MQDPKEIKNLEAFLGGAYTAWQAVELAETLLRENGFVRLSERDRWELKKNGKYYVTRGGSALIAFTTGDGEGFKIVASHTDSPCFKLKENAVLSDERYTRLNAEPYGGGLNYTFFDRPLKLAGRAVYEEAEKLVCKNFASDFQVVIPSLAIHMNREANEKFAPDPQTELPLLGLGRQDLQKLLGNPVSADIFAVCAEKPFSCGAENELLCAPRIDNLTSVYASLGAILSPTAGKCVIACLDSEEIGSRTRQGAGSGLLASVLKRISRALGKTEEEHERELSTSLLLSMDNAHATHPNHPEKHDPTNRTELGGGVVIKGHAGGAYTTDAVTSALVKKIFDRAGVKRQYFYNRSDMRSGSTLGAISLGQVSVPSVDIGIAQLAMHSAVETIAKSDYLEAVRALQAFFASSVQISDDGITVG